MNAIRTKHNPAGMTLLRLMIVPSHAGLVAEHVAFLVRRLKSTVNKVLSLRDNSPLSTLLQVIIFSFLCNNFFSACGLFVQKYFYICEQIYLLKTCRFRWVKKHPGIIFTLLGD